MAFECLRSEIIYRGRAFTIRRDEVRLPDGRTTNLDIVEHHGSVVIVPIDPEGNLIFVRQYRHAAGLSLLELPAGVIEPGESPLECAQREIREETGYAAGKLERVGQFYLAPGYSTEYMVVFMAENLHPDPLNADADEFLQVERMSLTEALDWAASGKMPDAKSLAALYLASPRLKSIKR
jgi:ADP-ribose pyrophosphatase